VARRAHAVAPTWRHEPPARPLPGPTGPGQAPGEGVPRAQVRTGGTPGWSIGFGIVVHGGGCDRHVAIRGGNSVDSYLCFLSRRSPGDRTGDAGSRAAWSKWLALPERPSRKKRANSSFVYCGPHLTHRFLTGAKFVSVLRCCASPVAGPRLGLRRTFGPRGVPPPAAPPLERESGSGRIRLDREWRYSCPP
jgi:hypothetical protein